MLTVGSLFSGIGGIDLGLERAGMRTAWQVEIDDYANKVLERRFPGVKRYRDVRECGGNNLERVSVIAGGFPCQDISSAGKRAGIKVGTRSGLWFEFARIIREIRPRYVMLENVSALLGGGIGVVLRDLAGCGYNAEWRVLSAAQFGAPHLRRRVFIVAHTDCDGRKQSTDMESREKSEDSDSDSAGLERRSVFGRDACELVVREMGLVNAGIWGTEPNVGRVAHGVPKRVDRLRCLGNAVVPVIAEFVGRLIVEHSRDRYLARQPACQMPAVASVNK